MDISAEMEQKINGCVDKLQDQHHRQKKNAKNSKKKSKNSTSPTDEQNLPSIMKWTGPALNWHPWNEQAIDEKDMPDHTNGTGGRMMDDMVSREHRPQRPPHSMYTEYKFELPIFEHRYQILAEVKHNQVIILHGN